jgi:hypothetical protein
MDGAGRNVPEGDRGRYYSDAMTAERVGPADVGTEPEALDVLDAPGGGVVGRATLADWFLDADGRWEATWCLSIGDRPLPGQSFLRGGEFVPVEDAS